MKNKKNRKSKIPRKKETNPQYFLKAWKNIGQDYNSYPKSEVKDHRRFHKKQRQNKKAPFNKTKTSQSENNNR